MASPSFSTDPAARRPPLCAAAPLLWSLLPFAAGILLERWSGPEAVAWAVPLMAAGVFAGFTRAAGRRRVLSLVVSLSFTAGFAAAAWHGSRPDPSWGWRPQRETECSLRVVELFNARKPERISGIGEIHSTTLPVGTVRGRLAAFYLESGPAGTRPALGAVFRCRAVLRYLPGLPDPDDFQMYLLGRDIFLTLNRGSVLAVEDPGPAVERLRGHLYAAGQRVLTTGCDEPDDPGHVLASMLLGNRSLLNDERIDLYKRTGTFHLFAVSGLHVGSVALCVLWLAGLVRLPRAYRIIPVLAATWGYVWLTGSSPSAVRAGIMISCVGLARLVFRQPHIFPALVLSSWLVLILHPDQLFHLGFQLSYGVVAAIVLIGLPLAAWVRNGITQGAAAFARRSRLHRRAVDAGIRTTELACVSLSAGLASMPLIIQHFERFTPGGLLVGILLNPLASISVMTGTITLLAAPLIGLQPAGFLALLAWPGIRLMEHLLNLCLAVPGAVSMRAWTWAPFGTALLLGVLLLAWLLQQARMQGSRLPAWSCLWPFALVWLALATATLGT